MSATTGGDATEHPWRRRGHVLECAFLALLIVGAFALRVWPLSKVHFWDEAVYLQNAEVILGAKSNYSELSSRPPLLSLIFAGVFLVWHHVYAAAIVTAFLNMLGPVLLYASGRQIIGRFAAGIASLLLAFSPFFVGVFPGWFSSADTGNSLLADSPALTLILLGFWLLIRALRRQSDLRFACVGFAFALTLMMRFASVFSVLVLSLLIFAANRWWRAAVASAAGFLAGIAPYLCWSRLRYGGFFQTILRGWQYYQGERQSPLFYARSFGAMFCWITLVGLVLWAGRCAWRTWKHASFVAWYRAEEAGLPRWLELFLWLWALVVVVFFFALRHQEPRYAMPAAPPLFLLAGSGLSVVLAFRQKAVRIAGIALVGSALVLSFLPDVQRLATPFVNHGVIEEMEVSEYLDHSFPPGTLVYSNFNYPVFGYYSNLPIYVLPETGTKLYDALGNLPRDGILIAYKDKDVVADPRPEWLAANPHFQPLREFSTLVLYRYRAKI